MVGGLASELLTLVGMSTWPPRRRASARTPLVGIARIGQCRFEIADVSAGGIGLMGSARWLYVGARIRITLSTIFGASFTLTAIVQRIDERGIGLVWSSTDDFSAIERVLYLVDTAARHSAVRESRSQFADGALTRNR